MKDYQTQNIRNIAIVGHGGEGKTTLTEALLWTTGAIDRMGRVEDGNTVSDYDTEEIRRQFSISTSVAPVEWKDKKINFIDIPGYFDFIGEMMGPLRIVDAALIVVGAVNGLNVGAEKAMAYTSKHSIPRAIFINSMDRENADYDKVIQQLGEKYQTAICPVMLPIYENDAFIGFSSLVTGKSYRYLDKFSKEVETTPEMRERIEKLAGAGAEDIWGSTFHSGCAKILRRDIEKLGYTRSFTIYDDDDQMSALKEILKKLNIDDKFLPPREIKGKISDAKNKLLGPQDWFSQSERDYRSQLVYDVYQAYEEKLKSSNALDFDDLIVKTLELFAQHPPVL